jgi:hypothetical protein
MTASPPGSPPEKTIVPVFQDSGFSGDSKPETGDWSCCHRCLKVSRFVVPQGGPISLRQATTSELVEFCRDDPELAGHLANVDERVASALREARRGEPPVSTTS